MKNVGLWINFQEAVIVTVTGHVVNIECVSSHIDSCKWQLDVWELPAAIRQRMSDDQLEHFYQNVSGSILDARSIFIFGPGEAKSELRRRLRGDHFTGRIAGFEFAERMTKSQIVTKVRHRFDPERGSLSFWTSVGNVALEHRIAIKKVIPVASRLQTHL